MELVDLDVNWQETCKVDYGVTGILRHTTKVFVKEKVAQEMVDKCFWNPLSKYYQMSYDDIINSWEINRERTQNIGHALDDYIGVILEPERMKDHHDLTYDQWVEKYKDDTEIMTVVNGWAKYWKHLEDIGYKMVKREQPFIREYHGKTLKGRADMILYYPPKDTILIIDWKSTADVTPSKKPAVRYMSGPEWVTKYPEEKLFSYGLQVNTYKHMLIPLCNRPYNINTAIIQIDRAGEAHAYPSPVPYDSKNMDELINWCVAQQIEHPDKYEDMMR